MAILKEFASSCIRKIRSWFSKPVEDLPKCLLKRTNELLQQDGTIQSLKDNTASTLTDAVVCFVYSANKCLKAAEKQYGKIEEQQRIDILRNVTKKHLLQMSNVSTPIEPRASIIVDAAIMEGIIGPLTNPGGTLPSLTTPHPRSQTRGVLIKRNSNAVSTFAIYHDPFKMSSPIPPTTLSPVPMHESESTLSHSSEIESPAL